MFQLDKKQQYKQLIMLQLEKKQQCEELVTL